MRELRVFVASPSVPAERKALARVVDEVNQTHGQPPGYRLDLLRWETHAAPGAGHPQPLINELIGSYDIFIGLMWRRFGTPASTCASASTAFSRRAGTGRARARCRTRNRSRFSRICGAG